MASLPEPDFPAAEQRPASPHLAARMRFAFYLENFDGGGVQKMTLLIADGLARRGYQADVLVCQARGPLGDDKTLDVNVVELTASSSVAAKIQAIRADPGGLPELIRPLLFSRAVSATFAHFPALARYLREARPDALIAGHPLMNVEAALARHLADVPCRLILTEVNDLSSGHPLNAGRLGHWLPPLCRRAYLAADGIIGISKGVSDDIAARIGIPRSRITTIFPPAVTPDVPRKARESVDHPWFQPGGPAVVLGAGRLGRAKDFETLIRAFAIVRRERPARLVILGNYKNPSKTEKRRATLLELAASLGVAEDVDLPGFVANPVAYMARASVFAVSSIYEGFCIVLAEALACGCPVVSTDCPSGPAEILDHGRYGLLVPPRDHVALADAIIRTIKSPPKAEVLRERGAMFSVERCVDKYEGLLLGRSEPDAAAERPSVLRA